MNNSVMKCCICNNKVMGEFITINDNKYHLCCIEKLQQENNRLKENVIHKHKYCSEMEGKYILEKVKLDQLRSWLEDYVEVLTKQDETVEGLDYLEGQMLLDYQSVLSKLNELEGGKNE